MFAIHLTENFKALRAIGLARSQRHYARVWLARGPHYLRDIRNRDRDWYRLSPVTAARLRANLIAVASKVPPRVAAEIKVVLMTMDRDSAVAQTMQGWIR